MSASVRRIRSLAISGLSASLAGFAVLAAFGAGALPIVSLGGLAIAAAVFGWLVIAPERGVRALDPAPQRNRLPPAGPT